MAYVPATQMLQDAKRGGYAVGHFNVNNLESLRAHLLAAQETGSPLILAVSGGMADYLGGYRSFAALAEPFMEHLGITVPVALHADHGTYRNALDAMAAGFSSVMFDGSALPFEENLAVSAELVAACRAGGVSLECEVGAIGGEEDGVSAAGEFADPEECGRLARLGITMLAAGIGNIHGRYPAGWPGLHFELLEEIERATGGVPLVLHGGSGVPDEMVRRAIALGVCKINVNTECQVAFTAAVRRYVEDGKDLRGKGYAIRALLEDGVAASKRVAMEKMELFGCAGKA